MASQSSLAATTAVAPADLVSQGLADQEVRDKLTVFVRAALRSLRSELSFAQQAEEAEDLFQEVVKCALASADRFDPERGSLLNWLGGILWNVAGQRKPQYCTAREPSLLEETLVDVRRSVPDAVALQMDTQTILGRLSADEAQLLTLHCEGWTAPEIGERLKLTPGNVRVRLTRLIKRVQDMFPNTRLEADHD